MRFKIFLNDSDLLAPYLNRSTSGSNSDTRAHVRFRPKAAILFKAGFARALAVD
jgi:hypothetical protein